MVRFSDSVDPGGRTLRMAGMLRSSSALEILFVASVTGFEQIVAQEARAFHDFAFEDGRQPM